MLIKTSAGWKLEANSIDDLKNEIVRWHRVQAIQALAKARRCTQHSRSQTVFLADAECHAISANFLENLTIVDHIIEAHDDDCTNIVILRL